MDDDDATGGDPPARETLPLTPADEAAAGDPLQVPVEWPDDDAARPLAADLDGPTVVNFFGSWCAPCVAEMPDFESVSRELDGRVDFVGVAVNDRTAAARGIVEQTGVTYPWARDPKGDVANAAQVTQMPATMFVDADGEVVTVHSGALDADELRELIAEHLGVPVGDQG